MRKAFWMWVHDSAEKLWHWVYYNKIRPDLKNIRPESGGVSYRYTYTFKNSDDSVKIHRVSKDDSVI